MPNQSTPSPTSPQPATNILSGITIAGRFLNWRILLTKAISITLLISGLKGLFDQVRLIFYVYPKLPDYYQALDFSPQIYQKIIISAVILTTSGLIDALYGGTMLFKPSGAVKKIHTLIGFLLLALTIIISQLGLDLNPREILQTVQQALLIWPIRIS